MALTQKTTDIQQLQTQRIGYMAVSLTHYDDDSEPAIAEGSVIELAGALFEAQSAESISGWAGIGNHNDVYIKLNGSAAAEFTTVAPTWSHAKQGWYGTGAAATHRYVGGLYKDGSGNYTAKWLYRGGPEIRHGAIGAQQVTAGKLGRDSTYGSHVVAQGATWTPPAGLYVFVGHEATDGIRLEVYTGSGWERSENFFGGGMVLCDGSTVRFRNDHVTLDITVSYRLFEA